MRECQLFFFFNDTATTEIYTLSLHDALPISESPRDDRSRPPGLSSGCCAGPHNLRHPPCVGANDRLRGSRRAAVADADRKSTRLNSSHGYISYAVFCLKKKTPPSSQPSDHDP